MNIKRRSSFFDYQKVNVNSNFALFDYIHAESKLCGLHEDFILGFTKILWPDFILKNNMIFLLDNFNEKYIEELMERELTSTEIQYWGNLIEISGLFDDIDYATAVVVANKISQSWKAKLREDFKDISCEVKYIEESDKKEVFLTIINYPEGHPILENRGVE